MNDQIYYSTKTGEQIQAILYGLYVNGVPTSNGSGIIGHKNIDEDMGKPTLYGSEAPASNTAGSTGQFYVNTSTGLLYICLGSDSSSGNYSWIGISTNYLYFGYADNAPSSMADVKSTMSNYIGISRRASAPTVVNNYSWRNIKGDTGDTGPTGEAGYPPYISATGTITSVYISNSCLYFRTGASVSGEKCTVALDCYIRREKLSFQIDGSHTVTITDKTHPSGQSFTITDGETTGNMRSAIYDPNGTVLAAGGIKNYILSLF